MLGVVKFSFLFIGMDVGVSAGLASLLLQAQVLFTLILAALLLGDKPSRGQTLGIIIAILGIAIVMLTVDTNGPKLGLVLVLLAAMAWAVSNMLLHSAGSVQMLNLMVWISLVPPIPLIVLSLVFESADWPALFEVTAQGIGALIYVTLVGTILGFAGWGYLLARHGARHVAPFALLVPIFGMASSAAVFGEALGTVRLAAATLVICGLVLTVFCKPRSQPPVF